MYGRWYVASSVYIYFYIIIIYTYEVQNNIIMLITNRNYENSKIYTASHIFIWLLMYQKKYYHTAWLLSLYRSIALVTLI